MLLSLQLISEPPLSSGLRSQTTDQKAISLVENGIKSKGQICVSDGVPQRLKAGRQGTWIRMVERGFRVERHDRTDMIPALHQEQPATELEQWHAVHFHQMKFMTSVATASNDPSPYECLMLHRAFHFPLRHELSSYPQRNASIFQAT